MAWLQTIGYQLTSPAFLSEVDFERGSVVGNATAISPQKWRVTVKASFTPAEGGGSRGELTWKIVTAGQLCTRVDLEYWRQEVATTMSAARGEGPKREDLERFRVRAMNGNLWRLLALTVVMIVPALLGVLSTGNGLPFFLAAIVLGAIFYIAFRAPRRIEPVQPSRAA